MDLCKICLFVSVSMSIGVCDFAPKMYQVNLDLPEQQRWVDIFTKNKEVFRSNIKTAIDLVFAVLPEGDKLIPLVMKVAAQYVNHLPRPMCDEIKGMASALDIDVGDLVLENILYDISAFKRSPLFTGKNSGLCTSIVARDDTGTIWHARNLDYGAISLELSQVLKNITMQVDFVRNGKVAYTATTYAGLTGLYTAQKPYAYSVSIDERNTGNVIENLLVALLDRNMSLTSHAVRMTFESAATFTDAVEQLSRAVTPAPVYYIVAGTGKNEGAVITKDRMGAANVWYLNDTRWFVVETNYDHWNPAPESDDRRDVAIKSMSALGQSHVNKDTLFRVLSTKPVQNPSTTYTTIMSPAHPKVYQTWVRT